MRVHHFVRRGVVELEHALELVTVVVESMPCAASA